MTARLEPPASSACASTELPRSRELGGELPHIADLLDRASAAGQNHQLLIVAGEFGDVRWLEIAIEIMADCRAHGHTVAAANSAPTGGQLGSQDVAARLGSACDIFIGHPNVPAVTDEMPALERAIFLGLDLAAICCTADRHSDEALSARLAPGIHESASSRSPWQPNTAEGRAWIEAEIRGTDGKGPPDLLVYAMPPFVPDRLDQAFRQEVQQARQAAQVLVTISTDSGLQCHSSRFIASARDIRRRNGSSAVDRP